MAYEVIEIVLVTVVISLQIVDAAPPTHCPRTLVRAVCSLKPNPNYTGLRGALNGTVRFTQRVSEDCRRLGQLVIQYDIKGLITFDGGPEHGIHVHESSDTSNGCESMGPHFNPLNTLHGAPRDTHDMRHLGDLGNVNVKGGSYKNRRNEFLANLVGPNSIIGKGLVITEYRDDLGLSDNPKSLEDGRSGSPVACCVIEQYEN